MIKCDICEEKCIPPHYYKITEIENEEVETFTLCNKCADFYLVGPFFSDTTSKKNSFLKNPKICSNCKMDTKTFIENGKLGCSKCYETFEEETEVIFKIHQHKNYHVGKKVKNLIRSPEENKKILMLQRARAIEHENYEEASRLTKEINFLEENP